MYYLRKSIQFIKQDVEFVNYFGLKIAGYDFLKNFIFRKNVGIGKKIYYQKYDNIKMFLNKKYGKIILSNNTTSIENHEKISGDAPIWIFWWQGINEDTPEVVNLCISSIIKHKGNHNIKIVTKENMNDYVTLPKYIMDKFNQGKMTITHFSDILRMELLYQYGGIWMDATILLTDNLPKELYEHEFYTIKHNLFSDFHVCKGLWTGYFLAANKKNDMIKCIRDLFREYWKNENILIAYLLIDCFIALCYENNKYFQSMIDQVPNNNTNIYFVDLNGNKIYDKETFNLNLRDTTVFKLHYKKKFFEENEDGKLTNYGYFVSEYL